MVTSPTYRGTIPEIAKAFQNDPRTALAQSALSTGMSTAPVAQGGWGVTDGVARAAQALVGAYMQKSQDKKYAAREGNYTAALKSAAALAGGAPAGPSTAPAFVDPSIAPGASMGLGGGAIDHAGGGMSAAAAAMALQGAPAAPMGANAGFAAPSAPPPSVGAVGGLPGAPAIGGSPAPAAYAGGGANPIDYYRTGIRPIEGGTDPRTGAFRTSPKGAVGPGQIMPRTGPEAARLAGLPWDEKRFRSDAAYNDALGSAYYGKQLQDFGNPVHAAAAYNSGAGATRRALRRANAAGDVANFENYYPAGNKETPKYVANFKAHVGAAGAPAGGTATRAGVVTPAMEAVPDAPAMPNDKPVAPRAPDALRSKRIDIANQLLSSDDPDMVVLAQSYLDKGLDEDADANKVHNAQEYELGKTGYVSELGDYSDARSQARGQQNAERNSAQQRNFGREQTATGQTFTAGQAAVQRNFEAGQSAAQRAFQDQQRTKSQAFQAGESQKDRDEKETLLGMKASAADKKGAARNAFYSTPTGLKMQEKIGTDIQEANSGITSLERFKALNAQHDTGGTYGIPGVAAVYGLRDKSLSEMTAIANDATLKKLGGSLGVAISDGDRKFISESNISIAKPREANENLANALIGSLKRRSDYGISFANAQADGTQAQFLRDWGAFARAVPIVTYGKDGKQRAVAEPMTFDQWQSRTKVDAKGKVVK